jgi:hypothetical protein
MEGGLLGLNDGLEGAIERGALGVNDCLEGVNDGREGENDGCDGVNDGLEGVNEGDLLGLNDGPEGAIDDDLPELNEPLEGPGLELGLMASRLEAALSKAELRLERPCASREVDDPTSRAAVSATDITAALRSFLSPATNMAVSFPSPAACDPASPVPPPAPHI